MKITVILEQGSRFNIELPEHIAINVYADIIGLTMKSLRTQKARINKLDDNAFFSELESYVLSKPSSEIKVEATEEKVLRNAPQLTSPLENKSSKKLVMLKCKGCEDTIASVVTDGQWSITCKKCGEDNEIKDLKAAAYQCPNCGKYASFFVKEGLKIVKCKNCQSDIDLVYHEKKDKYLSINLTE
jgi:ribosomal protein L37AE/L43A